MSMTKKTGFRYLMRNSARMYFSPLMAVINELRGNEDRQRRARNRKVVQITINAIGTIDRTNVYNFVPAGGALWMVDSKSPATLTQSKIAGE